MKLGALVILPVSIALSLATTHVADARVAEPPPGMGDHIERAVRNHQTLDFGEPSPAIRVQGEGVESISGGRTVRLQLPGTVRKAKNAGQVTLQTTGGRFFRTAVQDTGGGSFRALLYLTSSQAPSDYRFELSDGFTATPHPDGGLLVRDARGTVVGRFARPWATDAGGAPLITRYLATGSTVTQIIETTPGTSFPVVADPWWIPILILGRILLGVITKHAARQAASRGISHALIRQVIRNGARTRGNNGTTVYTQGKGRGKIRVVVDNRSGNVVMVTKG